MEFQVGHLIHISRHHVLHTQRRVLHGLAVWQCDPIFVDRHAQGRVLEHAVDQSRAESDELMIQPYGIWTDHAHGSELVAIAYDDSVFTPSA